MPKWPKGQPPPVRGSRKGKPNKVTADLREMIRASLDAVGGRAYLEEQARQNPKSYLALLAKIVPAEVRAHIEGGEPIRVEVVTGIETPPPE